MKLIIDISEEDYHRIASGFGQEEDALLLEKIFANGTPLPKGHGKIGDIDELHNIFKNACNAYNINNLAFISDVDMHFDLADAIIEADKTESEE